MEGFGLILSIILGGLAGWIASNLMKANTGLLMNIVLGIIGSVFGNWLFRALVGSTAGGAIGQVIVGIIGACILIWGVRAIRGRN
ncbi:GlsB/YeaQ/YmgE family stress response membrane protein [Paracoccus sp. (in: a-proteobacteria)]|uniref:GlsB/YeaQ/YmgE family stress response membrane protein n=1 Tax=Paracoccus sp. TaxID=267 RepID=UPI0026DF74A1|nr:GlsB/YeaQ/YmgE family stress response membrane protein [Paracoccus sp. (in: a-proteobacteria)]MDO5647331.1 GlsB/YeaQ/YmgE family stress response membrane protein [Paracoccus sp. (in: a-proteobacteria)]